MKNKFKYIIIVLIVAILLLTIIFIKKINSNSSNINKNNNIGYDKENIIKPDNINKIDNMINEELSQNRYPQEINFDLENKKNEKLEINNKLNLPKEFENCKGEISISYCILNTKEKINKKNFLEKFNKLYELRDIVSQSGEDTIQTIRKEFVKLFKNDLTILFEDFGNQDDGIIIHGKYELIDYVFNSNLITNENTCMKIPEILVKEYCLTYF